MDFPKSVPGVGLVGGVFVDENQATGQPGSLMAAAWGNAVTKELLSVIKDAELEPDEAKTDQLLEAIEILVARYAPPSVLPIFMQGFHGGSRASLAVVFAGMATPDDGLQLTAFTHPEIVRRVLRGDVKTCTEAEFQADPYKRGVWSLGNAYLDEQGKPQGWVRMSDRNGVLPGSLPAPFWRGGIDAKVGSIGKDTMRSLKGSLGAIYSRGGVGFTGGVFADATISTGQGVGSTNVANTTIEGIFDASKALPLGHTTDSVKGEFAPWHIYGVSYTITSNGVVNEAAIDAANVMAEVLLISGRVAALENTRGQPTLAGNAFLTGVDNKLVLQSVSSKLKLSKGDVVQVIAGAYDKLHTVESIPSDNELVLNYEHCGGRGNGPLKLPDYTGQVTIKRIAKWFDAPAGLGQAWVNVMSLRAFNTDYLNTTGRAFQVGVTFMDIGAGDAKLIIDGVEVGAVSGPSEAGHTAAPAMPIVPVGVIYRAQRTNTSQTITVFSEMR